MKEGHERVLSPGRSFDSTESHVLSELLQLLEGHEKFLGPDDGPLAHGAQRGRLVVGAADADGLRVFLGKGGHPVENCRCSSMSG